MPTLRSVRLIRAARGQTIEIPAEFELPGDEAVLHREGDRLIIEPKRSPVSLLDWLAALEPVEVDLADGRDELPAPRGVEL